MPAWHVPEHLPQPPGGALRGCTAAAEALVPEEDPLAPMVLLLLVQLLEGWRLQLSDM
jgi:hypothetical protein